MAKLVARCPRSLEAIFRVNTPAFERNLERYPGVSYESPGHGITGQDLPNIARRSTRSRGRLLPPAGISREAPQEQLCQRFERLEAMLISSLGDLAQVSAEVLSDHRCGGAPTESGADVTGSASASVWDESPRAARDFNTE